MRRASRLFQIVQILQHRRITTADWLAEELEVSVRTIYRDMQELLGSGVPIQGEAGVGYMLPRYFTLPPITFDHEELQALLLGIRMVKSWSDPGLADAASAALRKISAVIPENLQEQLTEPTLLVPDHVVPADALLGLGELRQAIKEKHKATIVYNKPKSAPSSRIIWPLALFYWGISWSVSAWCELREEFRNFRLDRIESLDIQATTYPHEPGKTLDDFKASIEATINKSAW